MHSVLQHFAADTQKGRTGPQFSSQGQKITLIATVLVSVGLGIYLLATFPATSAYFVGLAIGIDLIFDGGSLVGFAGAIHSLPSVQSRAAA